ncbi:MAG: response regulator transcription factor [Campylobacterota bacterium]|nr:response regulator transcription factor [Campylobacterota bacterium]
MINILMVEDDEELASIIQRYLIPYDIKVKNTINGFSLLEKLSNSDDFDMLIVDLTLPDIDGLELINKIRKSSTLPIIVSSARDDILDKVIALERGADDYLPKPYDPRELEARIKSILRREKKVLKDLKRFNINNDSHTIDFMNNTLQLTMAEYDILSLLIQKTNGVVSREEFIYDSLNIDDNSTLKNIDVMILRIRQKISKIDNSKKYIISVRGMGYKLIS